jgi:ABC-2 type transport system permease protein
VGGFFEKIANALPFLHAAEMEKALFQGDFAAAISHAPVVIIYSAVTTILAVFCFLKKMKEH